MKQKKKVIGALSLLVLFIVYQTSITAFTHVHYINGVLITHSHPFHGTHSHSKTSLVVIGCLSAFCSPEVDVYEDQHPMRPLLAVLEAEPATPTVKGEVIRTLSLRAPPAEFQFV
ncbi:hypothetical protein AAE250_12865 [Bacteroides sp. GD17]|uniref:hypothetical protein n=1 Tax=Bacteroides sp. GD17 TaxID=3139826 RepID=UPI0025FC02A3|nr:hypothetical protein [uncultured Bacteroides sp.]